MLNHVTVSECSWCPHVVALDAAYIRRRLRDLEEHSPLLLPKLTHVAVLRHSAVQPSKVPSSAVLL